MKESQEQTQKNAREMPDGTSGIIRKKILKAIPGGNLSGVPKGITRKISDEVLENIAEGISEEINGGKKPERNTVGNRGRNPGKKSTIMRDS